MTQDQAFKPELRTYLQAQDCGCSIKGAGTRPSPNRIHYCPLHAAAVVMFDALKDVRGEYPVGKLTHYTEAKVRSVAATVEDVTFRRYRVNSSELLSSRLFAATDTDQERTRWYTSTDDVPFSDRTLITYAELMGLPACCRTISRG